MRFVLKDLVISVIDPKDGSLLHGDGIGGVQGCDEWPSCDPRSECTPLTGRTGPDFEDSIDCPILPESTGDPVFLAGLRRRLQERLAQVEALQRAAVERGTPKTARDVGLLEAKLKDALVELAATKRSLGAPGAG